MTKLLQDAIERLKDLPESRQDELAAALIEVTEGDQGDYHLTDDQVEEVRRRRASPNRKFVSVSEARKRLRHFGV
jgi:4-aminobutyrate aminotransferase-like enzyme